MKLIPVGNVRKGDRLRASDESKELKTVAYVANARVSGYKVAVFEDGSQRALGHRTGFATVYPAEPVAESPQNLHK